MGEQVQDLGFLVQVYKSYEYDSYDFGPGERDTAWDKIGNYFMIDQNRENVEARIRRALPDPSPNKYRFDIRQAEQEGDGVHSLGEIHHPLGID